jgi:hypothetical protein
VLTRSQGGWWHGHLVRSNLEYHCDRLGKRTTLFFLVQHLGVGAARRSDIFALTLDAQGVNWQALGAEWKGNWDAEVTAPGEQTEADYLLTELLPRLRDSERWQRAIWSVVQWETHRVLADPGQFVRLE